MAEQGICRECGCTDWTACWIESEDYEGPCWWVEPSLCSGCTAEGATVERYGGEMGDEEGLPG